VASKQSEHAFETGHAIQIHEACSEEEPLEKARNENLKISRVGPGRMLSHTCAYRGSMWSRGREEKQQNQNENGNTTLLCEESTLRTPVEFTAFGQSSEARATENYQDSIRRFIKIRQCELYGELCVPVSCAIVWH
jgi:hypothetical protein